MSTPSESLSDEPMEGEPQPSQQEESEEIVVLVPEPMDNDDTNRTEDGGGPPGGSNGGTPRSSRIMEPAPPTYEEALTFFVRDEGSRNGGGSERTLQPAEAAELLSNGGSSQASGRHSSPQSSHAEDYEMATRVQEEEIERIQQRRRERSASLSTTSSSGGEEERTSRLSRSERNRWSVSSAPPGITHQQRSHHGNQPSRGRLLTIPEDEEMVIVDAGSGSTNHQPAMNSPSASRSNSKAYCYSLCFGFSIFSDKLHPILRGAWVEGFKQIIKTALPVYSTAWRYCFYSIHVLVLIACLILSFASTPLSGENIVRNASLGACLLVNIIERMVAWCGCCSSKKNTYHKFSDVSRNVLTDLTLYPAVVASIMNALKTRSYNVVVSIWNESIYANVTNTDIVRRDDAINLGMNVTVVLLFVVMVHLLRVWGVGLASRRLYREFKKNVSAARTSARTFLVLFFLHVMFVSIVQLLYLVIFGYRVQYEMSVSSAQPQVWGVSIYLFIMMVSGGLLPLFSISIFFLTTQKWAEEFPIAFFLDRVPTQHDLSSPVTLNRIEHKFKRLHDTNVQCSGCVFGFVHPLASPLQLLAAMSFFALWILFVFSYAIASLDSSGFNLFLSDSAHGITGIISVAIVYGLTVILSFVTNFLPLLYGFLGFAMLPFWGLFYIFLVFSALCNLKS